MARIQDPRNEKGIPLITETTFTEHTAIFNEHVKNYEEHVNNFNTHVGNFNNHVGDSSHITDSERTKWNSALYTISGSDYIDISDDDSNTISVTNIAESISDNTSDSLTTEKSIIDYVEDTKVDDVVTKEGAITKWHKTNEYFHMQKSVPDSLKHIPSDNFQVGTDCVGFIMKLVSLSKLKGISIIAATRNPMTGALTTVPWEKRYLKIVDFLTNEVIATSEVGQIVPGAATSMNGNAVGVFYFNLDNQKYFDADREYKVYFVNTETSNNVSIKLAYANGNGTYMTSEGIIFGKLSPSAILADDSIVSAPDSFTVSDTVDCHGYSCNFFVDTVKSEEFNHLSKQIGELKNYIAYMGAYINQLKN